MSETVPNPQEIRLDPERKAQFVSAVAYYSVQLKTCCGALAGDWCDCDDLAAEMRSAPVMTLTPDAVFWEHGDEKAVLPRRAES